MCARMRGAGGGLLRGRPARRPQARRPQATRLEDRRHSDRKSAGILTLSLRALVTSARNPQARQPDIRKHFGPKPGTGQVGRREADGSPHWTNSAWCGAVVRAILPARGAGQTAPVPRQGGGGVRRNSQSDDCRPGVTRESRHPRAWVAGRAHPGANGRQRQCPCDYRYASARLAGEFREPVMYEDTSGVWRHAVIHDVWRHAVIYDDRRQPCQRLCGT